MKITPLLEGSGSTVWALMYDVNESLSSEDLETLLGMVTLYSDEKSCVTAILQRLKSNHEDTYEIIVEEHGAKELAAMSLDDLLSTFDGTIDVSSKFCVSKKKIK